MTYADHEGLASAACEQTNLMNLNNVVIDMSYTQNRIMMGKDLLKAVMVARISILYFCAYELFQIPECI